MSEKQGRYRIEKSAIVEGLGLTVVVIEYTDDYLEAKREARSKDPMVDVYDTEDESYL